MRSNKFIILYFLLFLTASKGFGQAEVLTSPEERSKKYALILYLSGGVGFFPSNAGAPAYLQPKLARFNQVSTARIMWKPDYRLKAGFESGYMTFYSYKLTDSIGNKGRIALNAIPVLLEFSIAVKKHINLFAGPGVYILNTNLDYAGKATSQKITTGWMAAAAYVQPITKELGIGAEAKWLYAAETIRGSFGVQVQLVWRFLTW
ncbi:MAG TPA: hypothetical protein VF623_07355 [Segetibacter sp.]|jgi:hypothetical protein